MADRFGRMTLRAAAVVALAVLVDPVGAVQAQHVPTDQEFDRARDAQALADQAVSDAQARLAALAAELDEARVRAAVAVEAYNGARVELPRARRAAAAAAAEAAQVRDERTAADVELGRLAAAAYRSGGGLSGLSVVVNIVTDASIDDVAGALAMAARSQSTVRERWSAALVEAQSTQRTAEREVAELAAAEREAARKLDLARRAAAEHEDAVAHAAAARDELIAELATARGTTAELERRRQQAGEQRARAEREQAERERSGQDRRPGAEQPPVEPRSGRDGGHAGDERGADERDAERTDRGGPDREPAVGGGPTRAGQTDAGPSFAGVAAAQRAIDYARAQLGKPYVWAGAGPAGFDCSGLTMRAWQRGGVQLTHWSVAQARQTVAVPFSELRPGDLIFWSSNDAPSGAYHVAMYIGGGAMIHAPSPGGHVEIRDVFYWRTPSFYARVITQEA